jgi:hypothetical protein
MNEFSLDNFEAMTKDSDSHDRNLYRNAAINCMLRYESGEIRR